MNSRALKSHDIRQGFIDFFTGHGHVARPSSPLVPHGDPTLLFTNAGMVQFKNHFLGLESFEVPRAVTAQRCLRVSGKHNDLENVGPSPRHHTFFEMLGNFSFGDYFKEGAIEMAWELVTAVWGLPTEHLFATVFEEDDEAHDLWLKISSLPAERVRRCGADDNFWAMGDVGPCGPCSEIFVDLTPDVPKVPFEEGERSGRYLEIWNLVFMQFERFEDGRMEPLPNPSIDTGAGLERVTATLQGVGSNYDTDLFQPILEATAEVASLKYGQDESSDTSMRVIADHIRSVGFLLADGVIPSNEGRGYVLRRILRRAVRHGMRLGLERPFLGDLLPVLNDVMGVHYGELGATLVSSRTTVGAEEDKFLGTVAVGAQRVQERIEELRARGATMLDGPSVFRFYDTFGLPLENVLEIAEEEQFAVDEDGFREALEAQRDRSRQAAGGQRAGELLATLNSSADAELSATDFVGYDHDTASAKVQALAARRGDDWVGVDRLSAGDEGVVALDTTCFYAESGGQVGDTGRITSSDSLAAAVVDTQKEADIYLHSVAIEAGELELGSTVELAIDAGKRRQTERHHTATHLLHAALREHLGEGVRQAGSLVESERLRFDFTHAQPLSAEERARVEGTVNAWVRNATNVEIASKGYQEAVDAGAMALFGEKYGDVVRTVEVPGFSTELCGGCHVANSGQVGAFVVVAERGIASGVRRIEAIAGTQAEAWLVGQRGLLTEVEEALGVPAERASSEIESLREKVRGLEREVSGLRKELVTRQSSARAEGDDDGCVEVAGVKLLTREISDVPMGELRSLADVLRAQVGTGAVVIASGSDERVSLVVAVTKDMTDRLDASAIAKELAVIVEGNGGGRKDFAQAGGKQPAKIAEALAAAPAAVRTQLEGDA